MQVVQLFKALDLSFPKTLHVHSLHLLVGPVGFGAEPVVRLRDPGRVLAEQGIVALVRWNATVPELLRQLPLRSSRWELAGRISMT